MSLSAETAAAYVAKIHSGNMSDQELKEFELWLTEDESHIYQYQYLLDAWDALGDYSLMEQEVLELEKELKLETSLDSDIGNYIKASKYKGLLKKTLLKSKLTAIAASIFLFVFTASIVLFNFEEESLAYRYQTLVGQQKTVTLLDGSVVMLNTDTILETDFNDGKRRLKLVSGEAFFDVAEDPSSPMVIDVTTHKVTVLGTKFNVYRSALGIKVAVVEGKVSVVPVKTSTGYSQNTTESSGLENSEDKVLLIAGDAVSLNTKNNKNTITKTDVAKLTDWRDGLIRFDNQPLSKVISELNRYSQRKVLVEDTKIMTIPVSGTFRFNNPEKILDILDMALPITVVSYSDRYIIFAED